MNNKTFIGIVIAVVAVGIGLGGAFAGGVAMGKGQEEPASQATIPQAPTAPQSQATAGQTLAFDAGQFQQIRQRIQSGELTPEEAQQLRAQFGGQAGANSGFAGPGAGGGGALRGFGGGLAGTVESVSDTTIVINTPQGPLEATINEDTVVQEFVEVPISGLGAEATVAVTGQRDESGQLTASWIIVLPEGQELGQFGGPGGNFQRGGGFRGGAGGNQAP